MSKSIKKRSHGLANSTRVLYGGFEEDYKEFLKLFCAKNSYKFSSFVEVWNEIHFNLIYCGRETVAIVEEFTEDIVRIVLDYALSQSASILVKVCSVYMMYALYNKQPGGIKPSVRVVQKNVPHLKSLKDQLKGPEFVQVQFAFCFLMREGFFRFVITEFPYALERTYRKSLVQKSTSVADMITEKFSISQQLNDILESDDIGFDVCEKAYDDYNKAKAELPGSVDGVPSTSLQLVDTNFIKRLRQSVSQMMEGENKFMGNKEKILRREKVHKEPKNNLLVAVRSEKYGGPSTLRRTKPGRISRHKHILKEYCTIGSSDESDSENATHLETGNEIKDMPTVENE